MENEEWVKVYESYERDEDDVNLDLNNYNLKEKIWLHDVLDDNNIPYKNEVSEGWRNSLIYQNEAETIAVPNGMVQVPIYTQRLNIYVPKEYEKQVLEYIKEYEEVDNTGEDSSEDNNTEKDEDSQKGTDSNKRLKLIFGIVFLLVIVLPLAFALISVIVANINNNIW